MRNPDRIKPLLKLIEIIWTANPDLRLCQLLNNASSSFYLEDDVLYKHLIAVYHRDLDDESIRNDSVLFPLVEYPVFDTACEVKRMGDS